MNAAVLGGRIWVAGGLTTSTKATASTQSYDPTSDAWQPGPSLPEAVDHAMLVTYRNQAGADRRVPLARRRARSHLLRC